MDPHAVSPVVVAGGSKLRHPLRLAAKSKEPKPGMADAPSSSASRRARPMPSVSKSINVLDMSGKNNYSKPPRRFSGPTRSNLSPKPPTIGSISPISEARSKISSYQGASGTPLSDVSRSSARRKFCVLSSVSYWLTHIKLSEAASKHLVSLSFFKLALECGCEPVQRLREELKLYALRYNLVSELGELAEEVLQSYSILDDLNHDDHVGNSGSLKPKTLNSESFSTKETVKKNQTGNKKTVPVNKPLINCRAPIKGQKQIKTEFEKRNSNAKSSFRKTARENVNSPKLLPDNSVSNTEVASVDNKENMEIAIKEGPAVEEMVQT